MAEQNGTNTGKCAEEYVVKRGDSFYLIAHKLGVPLRDLLAANRDIHPARLMVGDVLCVPREEDDSPQTGGLGGSQSGGTATQSGTMTQTTQGTGTTTQSGGMTQTAQATGTTQSGTTTQTGTTQTTQATGTTQSGTTAQSGTTQTTQATGTTQSGGTTAQTGTTAQSGATTQSGGTTAQSGGTTQSSGTTTQSGTTAQSGGTTAQSGGTTTQSGGTTTQSGGTTTQSGTTQSGTTQATGMAQTPQPTCMTGQTAPDTTLPCTEDEQWIIQKGQTVSDLQMRGLVSRHTLETANPGVDLENLRVGQTVCIPRDNVPCALPETYTLAATETLEAVAMRFNLPVASLLRANPCLAPQDFEGGVTVILPR